MWSVAGLVGVLFFHGSRLNGVVVLVVVAPELLMLIGLSGDDVVDAELGPFSVDPLGNLCPCSCEGLGFFGFNGEGTGLSLTDSNGDAVVIFDCTFILLGDVALNTPLFPPTMLCP